MNDILLRKPLVALASVLTFAAGTSPAQQVASPPPATSAKPSADADEPLLTAEEASTVIKLSPFEVRSSNSLGYQESETLAGTRIRTSLRDVGSAISVANQQFLADTGATNSQTLLQYMTSTEVGGNSGNFGGLGDSAVLNDANQRLTPHSTTRVRGLDAADNTRDFFLTDIPWDGYNTSRIDIQRGPNSILFGNGSGAGIINGTLDTASFGRNTGTVETRYGSYGSYRGSFNLNRAIVPGQFALRVASLYDKDVYRQEPAFNRDKRFFAAGRFEPAALKKNGLRTSVRASYEKGDIEANRPRTTSPVDEITPWFIAAAREMRTPDGVLLGTIRPMISHAGYDPFLLDVASSSSLIAANPTNRSIGAHQAGNANSEPWIGAGAGNGVNGDWFNGFGAIFADPGSGELSYYLPGSSTTGLFNAIGSNGARDGNIAGLRGGALAGIVRFNDYAAASNFLYNASGVYRATTLTDPKIFDFYNKLLDGPNKREWSDFDHVNVTLDQTFLNDKAGFQVALDRQNYRDARQDYLGGSPTIMLDVWRYLPAASLNTTTGLFEPQLNPNFGRPFVASSSMGNFRREVDRETVRVTPFVDLNFRELTGSDNLLTKILGRHTITGLGEQNETTAKTASWARYSLAPDSSLAILGNANTNINDVARKLVTVSYLGPSFATASAPHGLTNITAVQSPGSAPGRYFNSTYLSSAPAPNAPWAAGGVTGLAPNQNGTSNQFQAENPANYIGWSSPGTVNVLNADRGDLAALTTSSTERRTETRSWSLVDQWALLDRHIVVTAGVRKDEIESYLPGGTGNRPLNTNGSVNFDAPFDYAGTPNSIFKSELLKSYSVVGHSPGFVNARLPFGLRVSAFYNESDNFKPEARVGIYAEPLAPPSGETKDYGILLSALDGRVSLKINRYETRVYGAGLSDAGNGLRERIGDEVRRGVQFALGVQSHNSADGYRRNNPFDPTGLYAYEPMVHVDGTPVTSSSPATQADWAKAEADAQLHAKALLDATLNQTAFLTAWNIVPSTYSPTSTTINYTRPAGLEITGDTQSKGTEFELYLKPVSNWNITLNAAKTSAQRINIAGPVAAWMESRWALYQGPAGQLRWFGGGATTTSTGLARLGRNAWAFYNLFRAQEGNDVPELRPWRFNIVNSYNVSTGMLKGAFVGGSYRWQDKNVIGYGVTEVTPALSASNPAIGKLDVNKPFHGPTEDAIDLWVGYSRKIFGKLDWRIQLNIRNAFDNARLVPINTNPDGSVASWRIAEGTTWELTNNIKF